MEKIKSTTGCYFEASVKYVRRTDNKTAKEQYAVQEDSFGEAEKSVMDHICSYGGAESFCITAIKRAKYGEIISKDIDYEDSPSFFLCSVVYYCPNEKTGEDKKAKVHYLVAAFDLDEAKSMMNEFVRYSVVDTEVISISCTQIQEIITKNPGHEEGTE